MTPTERRGYDRAVEIVRSALEAAKNEPRPRPAWPGDRKVRGSGLDVASRAARICALGNVLTLLAEEAW